MEEYVANDYPFQVETRDVIVYLNGGRTAGGETFSELMTMPRVHAEIPRGFALKAVIAKSRVEVSQKSWGNRELEIAVADDDPAFEQELLGRLQNWMSDIQPRAWLQWWLEAAEYFSVPIFVWCIFSFMAFAAISKPEEMPSVVHQQAWQLAREGVTTANETKALQVILSLESGYEPAPIQTVRHYPGIRFWSFVVVGLLILITVRIAPTGAIGLGGGKQALERQKKWVRTVSISVPSLVGSSFILPMVTNFLGWSK